MSITSISIRNFRSILSLNEKMQDLNIFVGQNDEGKSNILRALDLFFNHDRNDGYEFDWTRDYCCFAPKRIQKAEEIEIGLVITPPPSFADRNPVVWKKTWRRDGLYRTSLTHEDKTEIAPKSKVAAFVKAMRFDYVPAIKGKDYFQALMSKLHDMLEATVAEKVHEASGTFTKAINENTKTILEEILARLGLETTIQLPTNLRSLFAQLEFTSVSAEKPFSLNQRGDGIKVRHIPIVLRWLAEQANHLSAPGRPKTVTIWGYEEPENKAFAATEALASEQSHDLYLEMRQRHLNQLQLEKDKAEYSFRARRKLLQSIGLPEVREYRLRQLAQQEARHAEEMKRQSQVLPQLTPLLMLNIS